MFFKKPFCKHYQKTSSFGNRIHPKTKAESFHQGIDFAMPTGSKIIAPISGKAEKGEDKINGKFIKLHFVTKLQTKGYFIFDHLSEIICKRKVKKGDLIALSGDTGMSTGPHLHLGLFLILDSSQKYRAVNPEMYVDFN